MIEIKIQDLTVLEIDEVNGAGLWQDICDFCRGVVDGYASEANSLANK